MLKKQILLLEKTRNFIKMLNILVFLIFISICLSNCQNESQSWSSTPKPHIINLRRFAIFQMRRIREIIKAHELLQKQRDELDKKELERKNNEILKEETNRRKIYEKYLLASQSSSRFLHDFHSSLFL
jgi:hypothetical protein